MRSVLTEFTGPASSRRRTRELVWMLALVLVTGCRARVSHLTPLAEPFPCSCGDVIAEVAGCPSWRCLTGAGEIDNPRCACYPWFDEAASTEGDARSLYRLALGRAYDADEASAADQLRAGRAAIAAGLFARARAHAHTAVALDGDARAESEALMAGARAGAAEALLREAEAAWARNDASQAQVLLAQLTVELASESAASKGRELLLESVAPRVSAEERQLWDALVAAHPGGGGRLVDAALRHSLTSREAWIEGVAAAENSSRSKHHFRSSLSYASYALRDLTAWREANSAVADTATRGLESLVSGDLVRASHSLALVQLRENAPQAALRALEPALVFAPSAEGVRQLGNRIQLRAAGRGYGSWQLTSH